MKILKVTKVWDYPNHEGLNRFEVEYEADNKGIYYYGVVCTDELEAYQVATEKINEPE
jgi:hypothetical protein